MSALKDWAVILFGVQHSEDNGLITEDLIEDGVRESAQLGATVNRMRSPVGTTQKAVDREMAPEPKGGRFVHGPESFFPVGNGGCRAPKKKISGTLPNVYKGVSQPGAPLKIAGKALAKEKTRLAWARRRFEALAVRCARRMVWRTLNR